MKTANLNKVLSFGFSSVNLAKRSTDTEPNIIAVSTEGGFRINGIVSKLLGLLPGDYIMFVNNVDNVDMAFRSQSDEAAAFCIENGFVNESGEADFSTEACIAFHKNCDFWGIAKGIAEYDVKGNPKTVNERITKTDKLRYATDNFDTMLKAALESGDIELVAALERDGITETEQIEILSAFVQAREVPKYKGCKLASPSGLTGIGNTLSFSESSVWSQLKADLSDPTSINRVFEFVKDDKNNPLVVKATDHNGFKDVSIDVLVLGEYEDKKPLRRNNKEEEVSEVAGEVEE